MSSRARPAPGRRRWGRPDEGGALWLATWRDSRAARFGGNVVRNARVEDVNGCEDWSTVGVSAAIGST